jgi:glutamyl-tRNA synthetase
MMNMVAKRLSSATAAAAASAAAAAATSAVLHPPLPPVRVRYAPSPTGNLHLGGLRTALFNFVLARSRGGAYAVRIEDTDRTRHVEGAADALLRTLRECGVHHDEGPDVGGAYGPYVQSLRLQTYAQHGETLLRGGHAYRCFCTPQRLDELRARQAREGIAPMYDRACMGIDPAEAQRRVDAGEPHVLRLRVPAGAVTVSDAVHGRVLFPSATVDDQVLIKSDGFPTYHLANVVDDHLMRITHVLRGDEWLPSAPKHVLLYRAFGWEPPVFAHLPLLLNTDRSKLSKRHGDVAVEDFLVRGTNRLRRSAKDSPAVAAPRSAGASSRRRSSTLSRCLAGPPRAAIRRR